jgi:hypothetical protein
MRDSLFPRFTFRIPTKLSIGVLVVERESEPLAPRSTRFGPSQSSKIPTGVRTELVEQDR